MASSALNSATRRTYWKDRKEAHDLLLMIAGLPFGQAADVIHWALAGRTHRGSTGIPSYSPTAPQELSDEYIAEQYGYLDRELEKVIAQQRSYG